MPIATSALFSYGFRPFFLLAGTFAVLAIPAWLVIYASGVAPLGAMPAQYWHAHEMVFGFIAAAIAGFLLTAVPSWTGERGFAGQALVWLAVSWLLARFAFAGACVLPLWLLTLSELSFLPALVLLLAPPLTRARNRNTPLLAVLGALWICDAVFLIALWRHEPALAVRALHVAIDVILTLVTVIGGRIVPPFTSNALRRRGERSDIVSHPWLERAIVLAMVAVTVVDGVRPDSATAGWLAAVVAVAQALRLSGWRSFRTRGDAVLWILHVGYAWLPIGFALKALWLLAGVGWAASWLHALTMGALATMILAVMTRVALGHTGRPLVVRTSIAVAYLLLSGGVLVRVIGPAIAPSSYLTVLVVSGSLWTIAFALYLMVYAPILTRARVDGKPG